MTKRKPQTTAIVYLRGHKTTIYAQAIALEKYCEDNNITILKSYFEKVEDNTTESADRTLMMQAVFNGDVKPDLLLFTTLEVFAEIIDDALNLYHILAMYDVVTLAIHQPNINFTNAVII